MTTKRITNSLVTAILFALIAFTFHSFAYEPAKPTINPSDSIVYVQERIRNSREAVQIMSRDLSTIREDLITEHPEVMIVNLSPCDSASP